MDAIGVVRKNKDPRPRRNRGQSPKSFGQVQGQQTSSANIFSKNSLRLSKHSIQISGYSGERKKKKTVAAETSNLEMQVS